VDGADSDPMVVARAAAATIVAATGVAVHDIAVVLGSGWVPAVEHLGEVVGEIPFADIPGFPAPAVAGHGGTVRSLRVGGRAVLCLLGRVHAYEGHPLDRVVHGVRTAAATGCRTAVLTNASGGLRPGMVPGQPVLISDHLNLTGRSPLVGPRFVDLTDAWSPRLRALAKEVDPTLEEGVYAGLPGPHYETPAEIRMLRTLGADLVGMSTVHEAIAARAEGLDLLGLALVTNLAAGVGELALDHADVLAEAASSAGRMGELLGRVVARL
jgi:purine-nucleoside phosphorylase